MLSIGMLASAIPLAARGRECPRRSRARLNPRTAEQQFVASFIAQRYRVAQEPVSVLVRAAFDTGREVGLDPLLLCIRQRISC